MEDVEGEYDFSVADVPLSLPRSKRARPEKAVKKAASGSAAARKGKGSSGPAPAPAGTVRPECAVEGVVAVEDTDALDCGVCFLPLKPPIFQCKVGHVVCSSCCDKLKATGKCHVCGIATGGYSRCHAMDRLVESICIHCPNAAHGCTARPAYYDQHHHRQTCMHAPYRCPGKDCSFVGSTAVLLDHFFSVHSWPCTTKVRAIEKCNISDASILVRDFFNVRLRDGFNFILADCITDGQDVTSTVSRQYLFLLYVARQPHGCAISMFCIHPQASGACKSHGPSSKEIICSLSYRLPYRSSSCGDDHVIIEHNQSTRFRVACTDLSNGLPSLDGCFQFVVLDNFVGDNDKDTIKVEAQIIVS